MRKMGRAMCRKARKHLRMNVSMRVPKAVTLERIALHEAAHCIVNFAYGMPAFFIHTSPILGGERIGVLSDHDGLFVVVPTHESMGPVSVAGMVQDKTDWLGPGDAMLLLSYLTRFPAIGRYPSTKPALVDKTIAWVRRAASKILRRERKAVRAVAKLLMTPGRVHFDGAEIRKVAMAAAVDLPDLNDGGKSAAKCWRRAMAGDKEQIAILETNLTSKLVQLVIVERAKNPIRPRSGRRSARRVSS